MAASGLVDKTDAAAIDKAMNLKVPLVRLTPMKALFPQALEKNGVRNGSDIAKYLEKLNRLIPLKDNTDTYGKIYTLAKSDGFFSRDVYQNRLGRSPSTDSIAVSNFSSDLGSVDSCHYSSNGSDSNSVSSPSSLEDCFRAESPQSCFRAESPQSVPPSPPDHNYEHQEDAACEMELDSQTKTHRICPLSRTADCVTCGKCEPISFTNRIPQTLCSDRISSLETSLEETKPKENYLYQSKNLVPNSKFESFQNPVIQCYSLQSDQGKTDFFPSVNCDVNNCQSIAKSEKQSEIKSESISSTGTHQSCSSNELQQCNWMHCNMYIEGNSELVDHIRCNHVQVQMEKESYVCLWVGCKVYNKPSCSLSWLERHILRHGGSKPFKCIVDNCNQHFPTQATLQRHVNSHFKNNSSGNNGSRNGRCRDELGIKSFKRRKLLKYKRLSVNAKTEDFFDANIMEQIRFKLSEEHSLHLHSSSSNLKAITFCSKIKAVRTEKSGNVKVLLHWIPENILPDSWVSEKSVIKYKRISYSSLPSEIRTSLDSLSKGASSINTPRVKHRRK